MKFNVKKMSVLQTETKFSICSYHKMKLAVLSLISHPNAIYNI